MSFKRPKFDTVQRLDYIKNEVVGKKVLHLGCTNYPYTEEAIKDGSHLHLQLEGLCSSLYGFDADDAGLEILRSMGVGNLYKADLENLKDLSLAETFDVIVAGEMIEHLNNPGLFLEGIKRFMTNSSRLIVTTVNAYAALRFFQYFITRHGSPAEPVHPDHTFYFSYSTLTLLLRRHGFEIDNFYFYDLGIEHRPSTRWFLRAVNDISVKISPHMADGVIAVCKLGNELGSDKE